MSGKIRAQTWKHVIILIFSIVIALAMSLHFSEKVFTEEVLPAVSAEDGTAAEDAQSEEVLPEAGTAAENEQPKEALPEVGAAGLSEGSAEVDAGLNTAPEDDAAYVNTGSEAFGDAAEETSADALAESEAKASEEAVQTEAAANAETEAKAGKEAAETDALLNLQIQELVAGYRLQIILCVGDRGSEQAAMLLQNVHGMHDSAEYALAAAHVVDLGKSLQRNGETEVADLPDLLRKRILRKMKCHCERNHD